MTRLVWICIFAIISIIPILTTIKIIILQREYEPQNISQDIIYKERGPIFDRNGNILAMQINSWNVGLRLKDTDNPKEIISILSSILNISKESLEIQLKNPSKYVRIKNFIDKPEYEMLLEYKQAGKLKGVQINNVPWRKYPGNDSIARIIGYYGEEGIGLDGIEASYNKELNTLQNGLGNSIYITVDSVLQKSIEQIVKETLEESKSDYITTVLMDAQSGDILAYVDEPSFDLNKYYTLTQEKLTNKIISNMYEPGSVFKVFSISSVLDSDIVTENTLYDASHSYIDPNYNFVIQDIYYPGIISTKEIIKYSSNVGVSLATFPMDNDLLYRYLINFGFGQKTGIALPGESIGKLKSPLYWSGRSKATIALGQEIAVTAIQIISAATTFTNDGMLLSPNLIHKIVDANGNIIYKSNPQYKRQVIKPETAKTILQMMNSATDNGGTAHRLRIKGINISAKTGTAQVFDTEKNKYSDTNFIASTLSIVPTEKPQLIIYSVIHNPKSGEIYGGRTTAPMIRTMLEFILPYLGLAGTEVYNDKNTENLTEKNSLVTSDISKNIFQNYIGLSKREVWALFTNSNIEISMHGNGNVIKQNPTHGTSITKNSILDLYFE